MPQPSFSQDALFKKQRILYVSVGSENEDKDQIFNLGLFVCMCVFKQVKRSFCGRGGNWKITENQSVLGAISVSSLTYFRAEGWFINGSMIFALKHLAN